SAGMAAGIVIIASIGLAGWLVAREKAAVAAGAIVAKANADKNAAHKSQQTAEILRANNEFLLQQTFEDTNNLHGTALLNALEEAIDKQPTDIALWQAKTEVLKRANRLNDAVGNISRAIDVANSDTNVPARLRIELMLIRSRLFRQMGSKDEADTDYSQAGLIKCQEKRPPYTRDAKTKPEMLDLSPFFQLRH